MAIEKELDESSPHRRGQYLPLSSSYPSSLPDVVYFRFVLLSIIPLISFRVALYWQSITNYD